MKEHTKQPKSQLDKDLSKAKRIHNVSTHFEAFLKGLTYEEMLKFTDLQLFKLFIHSEDAKHQKYRQESLFTKEQL